MQEPFSLSVESARINTALALRDRLRCIGKHRPRWDLRPLWRGRALAACANQPTTIRRAHALAAVLDQVPLQLREHECIVGTPAGAYAQSLPPGIDPDTYTHYAEIDTALGERSFTTHFDHIAVNYGHLLAVGLPGLLREVEASHARHSEVSRRVFLDSVGLTIEAAIRYCQRWRAACLQETATASATRAAALARSADTLETIASRPPKTFLQAVQLIWLVHTIYCLEGRGAMAFGRLDQILMPYMEYQAPDDPSVDEILACLWAKLEEPGIINPIQNIAIGGQTRDGHDATNALSYRMLAITRAMQVPNGNLSARIHRDTPPRFLEACCRVIATGVGFPALFNDEVLVPALTDLGIPLEEARDYAFVGCIETFLPGRMPPWADSRVNLLRCVDRALRDGRDGLDDRQRGPHTGAPETFDTFEAFYAAFENQVAHMVAEHCRRIVEIETSIDPDEYTSPFVSALVADCIARGLDINMGGARYTDFHGPAGMGLGSTADALAAIKRIVYDSGAISWRELLDALDADFEKHETLRQRLLAAPKYGNDNLYVDEIAADVVRTFTSEVLAHRTHAGGRFVPLMAANVANIAAGRKVGATPDGRRATEPVSDAASATFGRDHKGPTALIRSLTRVDYTPAVGGTVVNVRFSPSAVAGIEGARRLASLVRVYMDGGGMQMQCNVTGRETLLAARADPEAYADLVVRVSGFSALYVTLDDAVQCDILARTEHW